MVSDNIIRIQFDKLACCEPGRVHRSDKPVKNAAIVSKAADAVQVNGNALRFSVVDQLLQSGITAQLAEGMDAGQHLLTYAAVAPSGHPDVQLLDATVQQLIHNILRFTECCNGNHGVHRDTKFRNRLVYGADQFHMDRDIRVCLFLFEFWLSSEIITVCFRHLYIIVCVHKAVALDDRVFRHFFFVHQHLFIGTTGKFKLSVMNQVVLAVNRIEAIEASGDIRIDAAVGTGAFNHADKRAVRLAHAEDCESVLGFADSFRSFHTIVPAIEVGVIRALG